MRKALRGLKNVAYQYNDIELKIREATNNDRFTVAQSKLADIARATNNYQDYPSLWAMLWKRVLDLEHVMHVQKALHVVEYLLRYGSERFINDAKRHARDIAVLQKYKHYDDQNQDDAKEARSRAKAVYALLTDDQLLAQERGKGARLASEGRLGGRGDESGDAFPDHRHRDEEDEEEERAAPAPVRRSSNGSTARSAPSNRSSAPGSSGAVRRRSVDEGEDPFETPVIPAAALKPAASGAPKLKSALKKQAAAAAAPPAEVDEPEDDDEAAAAAKRAKKEKKKQKKEAEARKQAEADKAAAAALRNGHGASSSASPPAFDAAETDLMSFAAAAPLGAEIDILTGPAVVGGGGGGGGARRNGAAPAGGDLADLFANQSIDSGEPQPLFSFAQNGSGNPFTSPEPAGEGEDGEPMRYAAADASPSPTSGGLVNLHDLNAPRPSKRASVDAGVSMSMMRSIQPLGASSAQAKQLASAGMLGDASQPKRGGMPSNLPMHGLGMHAPQQPYQLQGFMQHPQGVMGGGYPQHPHPQMGYGHPHGHHPQAGNGQHPGMQLLGNQHYNPQQPMLALMAPGAGYGMAPQGVSYGGGHAAHSAHHGGSFPAASPAASTFTQMRQGVGHSGPAPIFEVVAAQARPVEPQNFMQPPQQRSSGSDYKSFYGQSNGAQQQQRF